ncbi:MAG: hypothetical protein ACREIC_30165 [Limisphaerales bacterium]
MIAHVERDSELRQIVLALKSLPCKKVFRAVQVYARDERSSMGSAPATVSLSELISKGYLNLSDAKGLEEKVVSIRVDQEDAAPAGGVWMWVNGLFYDVGLKTDGSIETLAR